MASSSRRRWLSLIPLAALLATIVVYCSLLAEQSAPHFWYSGVLKGAGVTSEHALEPATGPNRDDVTIRLHPKEHINRAARTIELDWNVTKAQRRPDGVAKPMYLVNGAFPGPTIEACSGDTVIVNVRNQFENDEKLSIHWHGLRVSNLMDGAAGLTQCAANPGQTFTYKLHIKDDQDGTFWYHSHFDTQRADGLFGAFIVHKPTGSISASEQSMYDYEEDHVLMVNDWYHRPATAMLEYYTDFKNFKVEPAPDSLLLNGQGLFECSKAVPARPLDCKDVEVPQLRLPSKRFRLRLLNTGAITGFSISLTGFAATAIKVDGGGSVAYSGTAQTFGVLYPGERVDLIVERTELIDSQSAHVVVALDRENMGFPNLALTPIQQFPIQESTNIHASAVREVQVEKRAPAGSDRLDFRSVSGVVLPDGTLPSQAEQTVLLYTTISYLAEYENRPKGFINRTSWTSLDPEPLPLLAMDRKQWPDNPKRFTVPLVQNSWIDIVVNNLDDKGHPFHLHGHDFYVLSSHHPDRVGAYEAYNPFDASKQPAGGAFNLESPIRKDTVYIPSKGYVVLRVLADNPGLWLFHCHVLLHQQVGMGMAFDVGIESGNEEAKRLMGAARETCTSSQSNG